ncbi:MAG: hypothetical protein JWM11_1218, partial [Planctomycetaceae bacterium]|nr:hypothetical protein [Planctomycetaceae bacterium]
MSIFEKILQFNADRDKSLIKLKLSRMNASPFAFFRGTDHLFGEAWAKLAPPDVGPDGLICGDLHVENFGAYRTTTGDWRFDVNDFDEALVAPCGLDVVRCASSILLAAEDWQLSPIASANLVLTFLDHYRKATLHSLKNDTIGEIKAGGGTDLISGALGSTRLETQTKLLDTYTKRSRTGNRAIRRDDLRRPELKESVVENVLHALQDYAQTSSTPDAFRGLDVTGRIAGIGSLGVKRYLVLVADDGSGSGDRLLDIKQATRSSLLDCSSAEQPDFSGNEAQRTVQAQKHLQGDSAAGLDSLPIRKKFYRIREMIPDEDRCQIDRFRRKLEQLKEALGIIGRVVAWSHLRGARIDSMDNRVELGKWAAGSALDAVLKSAVRYADRTINDF